MIEHYTRHAIASSSISTCTHASRPRNCLLHEAYYIVAHERCISAVILATDAVVIQTKKRVQLSMVSAEPVTACTTHSHVQHVAHAQGQPTTLSENRSSMRGTLLDSAHTCWTSADRAFGSTSASARRLPTAVTGPSPLERTCEVAEARSAATRSVRRNRPAARRNGLRGISRRKSCESPHCVGAHSAVASSRRLDNAASAPR